MSRGKVEYERRLSILATLASNAPYIGLFGTVLGIVRSFKEMSKDIANASAGVMAGIAEALIADRGGPAGRDSRGRGLQRLQGHGEGLGDQHRGLTRVLMAELKSAGKKD